MKKSILILAAALMLPAFTVAQQITWQTTRNGSCSGYCQLESNKISLTVSPFYIDVVEEAVIGTRGSVSWGDPSTLEIIGTFTLSKGTALRSMLLWNGQKILKAKLLDRNYADSAYQAIVNRQIPRDPAIIEYLGNDTYRFRIFPVAINASRKIRILYAVPFHCASNGPVFEIKTAFTVGAQTTPTQIPIEIEKASQITGNYLISYGSTHKTIQFGSTYIVPYSDLAKNGYYYNNTFYSSSTSWVINPISIMPDTTLKIEAYTAEIDSGATAGNYTAVYAMPPEMVLASYKELGQTGTPTFEAKIMAGTTSYITDFNNKKYLGVYLKSPMEWDSTIYWTVYTSTGKIALTYSQKCSPQTDSLSQSILPLIWGAKYSLVEGTGNLGALYGFVDQNMSLLARENDTLCAADALAWAIKGVPVLKPDEIKINHADIPIAPIENVIFEFSSSVLNIAKAKLLAFEITLKGRMLNIAFKSFKNGVVRVALFDISGKQLASWNNLSVVGNSLALELPQRAGGFMIVRVYSGKAMFQKTCVVVR
jgi:hypothetical protein